MVVAVAWRWQAHGPPSNGESFGNFRKAMTTIFGLFFFILSSSRKVRSICATLHLFRHVRVRILAVVPLRSQTQVAASAFVNE